MEIWESGISPNVRLIQQYYRREGCLGWNNDQVSRLCRMLRLDPYELCALCGEFDRKRVQSHFSRNTSKKKIPWPATLCIHFTKWRNFVSSRTFNTPARPDPDEILLARIHLANVA